MGLYFPAAQGTHALLEALPEFWFHVPAAQGRHAAEELLPALGL